MSLAARREAPGKAAAALGSRATLVEALGSVSGLSATTSAPDVATAGAAWPRWVQTTYAGKMCDPAADEFDVYVILPADYAKQTVDDGDAFRELVEVALWPVAIIAYAEPVAVLFNDSQTMPGLRFRVTVI